MPILHADYGRIIEMVPESSRVLDLGCGNGELLLKLIQQKKVTGVGVDIDQDNILECIRKGLSVFQGDIDEGLAEYPDKSYDYVVLNQTLQVTRRPDYVIKEMLRVGKKAIVSFPNFGYWRARAQLFFRGRMPVYGLLPFKWYETPNIHMLTIKDFRRFCRDNSFKIIREMSLLSSRDLKLVGSKLLANLLAEEGIFVIAEKK
jgi:methionine biosynthesis protein MetW